MEATIKLYARDLSEYPADIVRGVLDDWGRREKWFPAWAELAARLDEKTAKRRRIAEAVKNPIKPEDVV